jgi:hypothetical protein
MRTTGPPLAGAAHPDGVERVGGRRSRASYDEDGSHLGAPICSRRAGAQRPEMSRSKPTSWENAFSVGRLACDSVGCVVARSLDWAPLT